MHVFITLVFLFFAVNVIHGQVGYFCVPVADLVDKPFVAKNGRTVAELYDKISISPEQGKSSCLRVHQGIFNELVKIIRYENSQVFVELSDCYSCAMPRQKQQPVRLWTRADWVVAQETLKQLGIPEDIFPKPIENSDNNSFLDDRCITLILPWYDQVTDVTYSAGTRFVMVNDKVDSENYTVTLYHASNKLVATSQIPKNLAIVSKPFLTRAEQKKAFVELLQHWCSLEGIIPFVWGGSSFNYRAKNNYAVLEEEYTYGSQCSYWRCPLIEQKPYSGFDASGLILRAAQIVGAPYFCINSATIANSLQPLFPGQQLEEGDIVWMPGYVGVVGSLENNELIEAQGYSRGYGKIHSIALKDRYATIKTWQDFLYCYEQGIPLQSLNAKGQVVGSIPKFFIYKFLTNDR